MLEGMSFRAGLPGDPYFPYRGLHVAVMDAADPTNPDGPRKAAKCTGTLVVGQWHNFRLVHSPGLFEFYFDGTKTGEVVNDAYDLSAIQDWMLTFGDGDSHPFSLCDVSIDNIVLAVRQAIEESGREPEPRAKLRLLSLRRDGSTVTAVIKNVGEAPLCGALTASAGLSYCDSWVPEWCTVFHKEDLGETCLAPGEEIEVVIQLPPVPADALSQLAERLETIWTAYVDPDPEDYIGLLFEIEDANCVGFLELVGI